MKKIIPPESCPSCSSKLQRKNDILYCMNENCETRTSKRLVHFTKKMSMLGWGPATIEKLELSSLEQLYSLTIEDIKEALGSDKLATKLYKELSNSKLVPANVVLPSLSIPLIGNSVTGKLASSLSHLDDVSKEKLVECGIGPKASENLLKWIKTTYEPRYKGSLPLNFYFEKTIQPKTIKGTVCITGKLNSFKTKALAEKALVSAGYVVKSTVTKAVTILINESGKESTKVTKARESGITIVNDINNFLGET